MQDETQQTAPLLPPAMASEVHWLTRDNTTVFEGTFNLLHCAVKGATLYRGVFAIRLFPVSFPSQFISLRYTDSEDKIREVGVIRDLDAFPLETVHLIRASMAKHYYEQVVKRVLQVTSEFGLLFFKVTTARGQEQFTMRWQYDRAEDYGEQGKVLLDVNENRYVVPDVEGLEPADRRRLRKYIYW